MNDEDIERVAVQELLLQAKKAEESLKPLQRQTSCINKRLLSSSLASTLRNPVLPKSINRRKYVGLQDEHFDEEDDAKKKRPDDGPVYDPNADYIYDARRYFNPEKYREIVANRRKKEKILKAKSERHEAATIAATSALHYYQPPPKNLRRSQQTQSRFYFHPPRAKSLPDDYDSEYAGCELAGSSPHLEAGNRRNKKKEQHGSSSGRQRHHHKSKSEDLRHSSKVRLKPAHKHSRRKSSHDGDFASSDVGKNQKHSKSKQKRTVEQEEKASRKSRSKSRGSKGSPNRSHRQHRKHSRQSTGQVVGTLAGVDGLRSSGRSLVKDVDTVKPLPPGDDPASLDVWNCDYAQKDRTHGTFYSDSESDVVSHSLSDNGQLREGLDESSCSYGDNVRNAAGRSCGDASPFCDDNYTAAAGVVTMDDTNDRPAIYYFDDVNVGAGNSWDDASYIGDRYETDDDDDDK